MPQFPVKQPSKAMETTTYTMIGSDGQQYGPVALAQIKSWIGEGRIGPETKIMRSDTQSWLAAAQYGELGLSAAPPIPPVPPVPGAIRAPAVSSVNPQLERRVRSAARWFYWVAGLSLVNTFMASSEQGSVFLVGLAVPLMVYFFAAHLGSAGPAVGIGISVAAAALFAMFGYFAWKRHSWSFIVGMVLYGLDAALAVVAGVLSGDWSTVGPMVGFHVFVLFWLYMGLKANLELEARARNAAV
jgi:hypothetical protein